MTDHRALLTELLADVDRLLRADRATDADGDDLDFQRAMHDTHVSAVGQERLQIRKRAIEAALERLDAGTYGRCIECDDAIPAPRLRVFPDAECCVPCARRRETAVEA